MQVPQPRRLDRAAHQRAALIDHHLQAVLPRVIAGAHRRPPIFEQEAARDDEVDEPDGEQRHAQPGDVEHAEWLTPLRRHQAADDDVGARADQGAEAAEHDRGVHRHQQLGDAEAVLLGPVADRRHHQRHHGRVVGERGDHARCDHRANLRRSQRLRPAERPVHERRQGAGPLDGRRYDEQRRDRHHALVAHPLEGLVGRDHPGGQQEHHPADHHHVGSPLHKEQRGERDGHHRGGQYRLPVAGQRSEQCLQAHRESPCPAERGGLESTFTRPPRRRKGKPGRRTGDPKTPAWLWPPTCRLGSLGALWSRFPRGTPKERFR